MNTIGATKRKMGHETMTMPLSGVVCHPKARTCYYKLIYQNLKYISTSYRKIRKVMQNIESEVI